MKFTASLILLALLLLPSVSVAQHEKTTCYTPEAMTINVDRLGMGSSIYYKLYGVDIGFENLIDVIIFTNGHEYVATAFDKGCYVDYKVMNQEQVIEFLNSHSKKVSDA